MLWHTWWQLICDICDKWNKYKSHTCEEGGAHLRISFWHLLMNFEKPEKIRILKKFYKNCWRYHHFTHVYQKPHIWGTVSERRSETNFFVILGWFLPFTSPPNNPENQNYEKMKKKTFGDVIILDLCNKKHDQVIMLTQIWSVTNNFLSF